MDGLVGSRGLSGFAGCGGLMRSSGRPAWGRVSSSSACLLLGNGCEFNGKELFLSTLAGGFGGGEIVFCL